MPRHCYVLRVFTRDGSGGNPLGVVTDILGLDDEKMQQIATDLAFSETIFLSWFEGTMPKARIFTPTIEIPYAGHPLVGAAWVLLNLGPVDPGGIECSIGPVKIRQVDETTWIDGAGDQPVKAMSPDLGPGLVPIDSGNDAVDGGWFRGRLCVGMGRRRPVGPRPFLRSGLRHRRGPGRR
jgi:PhzF family phenazine biosynthesis protein